MLQGYRYFLGIRPNPRWYPFFQRIAATLCQPIRLDLLHLTLCVVAQSLERDRFILRRVESALSGERFFSFPVNLSRVVAGPQGAFARTFGRQDEMQHFYNRLTRLLLASGIEPLHRKSGLHPHVTLSYRPCEVALLRIALQWFPSELLLIESEVGLTKHNPLARWPLSAPRQGYFDFGFPLEVPAIAAAGPARRSAA